MAVRPIPTPTTLEVSGFHGKIGDLDLTLTSFSHEYPDDIDILLVAPDGTTAVEVMSDAGGTTAATSVDLTLDQDASAALPDAARWQPVSSGPPTTTRRATATRSTPGRLRVPTGQAWTLSTAWSEWRLEACS